MDARQGGRSRRSCDASSRAAPPRCTSAVAEAIPLAATGRNRKKALLIISDGNDSSSYTRIEELKRLIRESEVLVYAIGIDAMSQTQPYRRPWFTSAFQAAAAHAVPVPDSGRTARAGRTDRGRRATRRWPPPVTSPGGASDARHRPRRGGQRRVLREITDDSGGRTEIIWQPRDLDGATAGIADELSKQYFLGYPAGNDKKDGKWHSIRVEVTHPDTWARRGTSCGRAGGYVPRDAGLRDTARTANREPANLRYDARVQVLAAAVGFSVLGSVGGLATASVFLPSRRRFGCGWSRG